RRQADLSRRREEQTKTPPAIAAAITSITTNLTSPPPALIVGTNTKYAILDRGRNAGVSRSDVVRCFARGAEIVRDGEQLGFDETPIGSGVVREVREQMALVTIEHPRAPPKVGDVCYRSRVDFGKVGVMPILHDWQ